MDARGSGEYISPVSAPPTTDRPPQMLEAPPRLADALADRYRIERELGAGGMATVYLAYDLKHDRRVAEIGRASCRERV